VLEPCNAKVLRTVLRGLGASNRAWLLGGCVGLMDKITSPETELTSRWCSNSRTFVEPMSEAKQMTAAQAAGAASHTMVVSSTAVRVGRRSVSSRLYSSVVEYSRVLVFHGGVLECSSRMKGNFQVRFLEGWPPAMGAGYSARGEFASHRAEDL
jgi:hypothetical protein